MLEQTEYGKYIDSKKEASQVIHAKKPHPTSESELTPTSDKNIPQDEDSVNSGRRDVCTSLFAIRNSAFGVEFNLSKA